MATPIAQPAAMPEPTLRDLVALLRRARWAVLAGVALGAASGAAYLARTPKVYEAEVVVTPADQGNAGQLGGILGQLGGVGSLLGVNLPMQGNGQEALAAMRSRTFAQTFIQSEGLMPLMFPQRWDSSRGQWRPDHRTPSASEAVRHFDEKVRFVEEDRRTGMVSVRIRLSSRTKVAGLANRYVALANERLRSQAIRDAESALQYLRTQLAATSEVEVRQSIYRVMESQLTVAALARTRRDYAFRVLDPATEPDAREHVAPKASKVLPLGLAIGALIGLVAGLLWPTLRRQRHSVSD